MEIFKDIHWYEWKYQISDLWNIKSLSREKKCKWNWIQFIKWKILKQVINKYWYMDIKLCKNSKSTHYLVHRLVAQVFHWLDINNIKILVCHKDDNPINNNKNNLFLWTHKDNSQDMINKWRQWNLWKFWQLHHNSKKVNQYSKNLEFIKTWDSLMDVKRELWINYSNISLVCNRKRKTAWGYKWKYLSI